MQTALKILITADVAEAVNNINTVADAAAEAAAVLDDLPQIHDQTVSVTADSAQAQSDLSDLSDLSNKEVVVTANITAPAVPQVPDLTLSVTADTAQAQSDLSDLSDLSDKEVVVTANITAPTVPQVPDQAYSVAGDITAPAVPQVPDQAYSVVGDITAPTVPEPPDQAYSVVGDITVPTVPEPPDQAYSVVGDITVPTVPEPSDQAYSVVGDITVPTVPEPSDQAYSVVGDITAPTVPEPPDQVYSVAGDITAPAVPQVPDQAYSVVGNIIVPTVPEPSDQSFTVTSDIVKAVSDLSDLSDKSDIGDKSFSVKANVKQAVAALDQVTRRISKAAAAGASWAAGKAAAALKWGVAGATAALAAGSVALGKYGSRAEDTRLAFRTMLGSMEDGDAMMAKLDRFSNSTPYSGDQVNQAAKTLLAFGVAAGDVENTLRKVGDVASGSGKDFNELSAIYGKVFAKGVMDTEAMNQMVEAGIPIVKTLGEMFGKSGTEIYAMAEKGEITAAAVDRAFAQMSGSGGVFSGMMQKQSETVAGMWGAITGQIAYAASNIGEALLPVLKVVLGYLQSWADKIAEMSADGSLIQWFGKIAVSGVTAVGELVKWSFTLANHFAAAFKTIGAWGKVLWNGLKTGLLGLITLLVGAFEGIVNAALAAYNAVVRFFGGKGKEITWTWTKASAGVTADTARETVQNYREATDGRYFADAMARNGEFDAAVNNAVNSINSRLSAAVDKAAAVQRERTANIDKQLKTGSTPDEVRKSTGNAAAKTERLEVDQLARVGLYNFSGNDVRSLDIERNNLIRKLLKKDPIKLEVVEV